MTFCGQCWLIIASSAWTEHCMYIMMQGSSALLCHHAIINIHLHIIWLIMIGGVWYCINYLQSCITSGYKSLDQLLPTLDTSQYINILYGHPVSLSRHMFLLPRLNCDKIYDHHDHNKCYIDIFYNYHVITEETTRICSCQFCIKSVKKVE